MTTVKREIPKILHYCWFGNGKKNKTILHCMKSWGKYCSDYKIMRWDEETFDISKSPIYVQEAYKSKKWAFVSDYVRLWALYNFGGIYVDTDVEIIKSLNEFLNLDGFSGFSEIRQNDYQIPAALMGAVKNNNYIKYLLGYYDKNRRFIKSDGSLDIKANIFIITEMTLNKYNFKLDNSFQKIKEFTYYPNYFFTPNFKHHNHNPIITKDTYVIHYHNESWMPFIEKTKINLLILLSYMGLRNPLRKLVYKLGILKR